MAHSFEHGRTPEGFRYWTAFFYGLTIIAAGAAAFLVVYYAL